MAKVWPIYGEEQKGAHRKLAWLECVQRCELAGVEGTDSRPRGDGEPTERMTLLVIEPTEDEARQHGLRPGSSYISPLPPAKIERLWAELKVGIGSSPVVVEGAG